MVVVVGVEDLEHLGGYVLDAADQRARTPLMLTPIYATWSGNFLNVINDSLLSIDTFSLIVAKNILYVIMCRLTNTLHCVYTS